MTGDGEFAIGPVSPWQYRRCGAGDKEKQQNRNKPHEDLSLYPYMFYRRNRISSTATFDSPSFPLANLLESL